jgi:hypothetical protein
MYDTGTGNTAHWKGREFGVMCILLKPEEHTHSSDIWMQCGVVCQTVFQAISHHTGFLKTDTELEKWST